MTSRIHIKRAYEAGQPNDGYRVLVDRLWPRGLSKQDFKFDLWCKELAPTSQLRTWFGHKVELWDEFRTRYQAELRTPEQEERMRAILDGAGKNKITLVYGAKDTEHNQAVVLAGEIARLDGK